MPDLTLPPDSLDREAEVTPTDKAQSVRFWAHYGTPLFRRLLAAIKDEK